MRLSRVERPGLDVAGANLEAALAAPPLAVLEEVAFRLEEVLVGPARDAILATPAAFRAGVFEELLPHGMPGVVEAGAGPLAASFDPGVNLAAIPLDGVGVAYGDTFKLHSNPSSTFKVYLDFDGHTTTGTQWNSYWGVSSFYSPAYSLDASEAFTATELVRIQQIWQRVAEYFSPFNIDVTTEDPGTAGLTRSGAGDTTFGIRVVVTDEGGKGYGGIAWIGSFDWSTGEAAFVYANNLSDNAKYIADAAAHEAGHALGVNHDGQSTGTGTTEYYYGHGSGVTDWAPVMGAGYYANIVQWSNGAYYGATQKEDDLSIITTQNSGVTYAADEAGNTLATAAALRGVTAGGVTTVESWGVISGSGSRNDVDVYRIDVGSGGSIDLTISSWTKVHVSGSATPIYDASPFTMLDLSAVLTDAAGRVIAVSNDVGRLDAAISVAGLAAGSYYLVLDGVGWGDPMASSPTGYTEYGSLGQYMIRGSFSAGSAPAGVLAVDRTAVTTSETGAGASFRVFLAGADGSTPEAVTVAIAGLDPTEGTLGLTEILLTRASGYSATVNIGGLNDRDDDGSAGYVLSLSAGAFGSAEVAVTNLDNDIATASVGARGMSLGAWKKAPTASNATLAALAADDGVAMTISEGAIGSVQRLEWQWQFTGLTAGQKVLHLDAEAAQEAMFFQYSTNGSTWTTLGGGAARTDWEGDFTLDVTGSSLWIRVVDSLTTTDKTRSSVSIDVLTLEDAGAPTPPTWFI